MCGRILCETRRSSREYINSPNGTNSRRCFSILVYELGMNLQNNYFGILRTGRHDLRKDHLRLSRQRPLNYEILGSNVRTCPTFGHNVMIKYSELTVMKKRNSLFLAGNGTGGKSVCNMKYTLIKNRDVTK